MNWYDKILNYNIDIKISQICLYVNCRAEFLNIDKITVKVRIQLTSRLVVCASI